MKEVRVQSIALDQTNTPVVILKEVDDERVLPIWVGPGEANAIAVKMKNVSLPRPLTHDLFVSMIAGLGGTLRRVLITRVEERTYFAELIIDRDGELVSIDARPSDSIALALRTEARIFAADSLLMRMPEPSEPDAGQAGGLEDGESDEETTGMTGKDLEDHLRKLRPEDLGRFDR